MRPGDDFTFWQGATVIVNGEEIGWVKEFRTHDADIPTVIPTVKKPIKLDEYVEEFEAEVLSKDEAYLLLTAQLDMWGFFEDRNSKRSIPYNCVAVVMEFMYYLGFTLLRYGEPRLKSHILPTQISGLTMCREEMVNESTIGC
jgi:hypothetical protein